MYNVNIIYPVAGYSNPKALWEISRAETQTCRIQIKFKMSKIQRSGFKRTGSFLEGGVG